MKKTVFVFSTLIICVLILFQISKYSFLSGNVSVEMIIAAIALVFLGIGLFINRNRNKKLYDADEVDLQKLKQLGISNREYEVLIELSKGLSNKEIGEKLHVSESTIKTHVSNLLVKLNAKRRTQAIQIAKELSIIGP